MKNLVLESPSFKCSTCLTLIKSSLSGLSIYFLYFFLLPIGISNRLEKIQRDFLHGGMGDEFKFHLVNWNICCIHVCSEGLLLTSNQILLDKWFWCYGCEEMAFSRQMESFGVWVSRGVYGMGLWKYIRSGWDLNSNA